MSISSSTLQAIQQAGQALLAAKQATAFDVQSSSERVVAAVVRNPFSPELDQAYSQLRGIARLVHELQAQEDKIKELYAQAGEISGEKLTVMKALPNTEHPVRSRAYPDQHVAEDVFEKSAAAAVGKRAKIKAGRAAAIDLLPINRTNYFSKESINPENERIKPHIYSTRDYARSHVFDYNEGFYDRIRQHSHVDQLSRLAFEQLRTGS